MRKMMARSDYEKNKVAYRNEEQFNNFSVTKNKPRMSLDFEKHIGRNDHSQRYTEDPEHIPSEKVSKIYQKLLFDQANYSCFVDYKKNGKTNPKTLIDDAPVY